MQIRINAVIQDSIVDGPGLRLAVFAQGCIHACAGCHNPQTHDPNGGKLVDTAEIIRLLDSPLCAGLTLTGGEPFLQSAPCLKLALTAKESNKNVWIYTGYTYEGLIAMRDEDVLALMHCADVLVDGPFILSKRSLGLKYRGSHNQRVIDMQKTRAQNALALWEDAYSFEITSAC